jgi:hypothetical protein
MNNEHINFNEQREFGIMLNATFSFLRQNFSKLGKALMFYAGPFLLLQAIAKVYYDTNIGNINASMRMHGISAFYENFFIYFSLYMIATVLSSLMIMTTVYSYIKLYVEKGKDGFTLDEVWKYVTKYFLRIFGASFVGGLVIIVGTILCILPGIYLSVSLSLMMVIIVIEDKSFGDAFSRSFKLSHYHWWWIVLLLIVIYAIIYVVSLVFAIPQLIITFTYRLNTLNPSADYSDTTRYLMIFFTFISTFVTSLMMSIIYIALAFEYFNIVEMKESPSLQQKIDELEQN